ncbi:MAG: hypothetical protein ACFFBT_03710 [Promethearchaeota archaeon]
MIQQNASSDTLLILILITLFTITLVILIKTIIAELKQPLTEQEVLIFIMGFILIIMISLIIALLNI